MSFKVLAIFMTFIWLNSTMQQIYGSHITEIILEDEPMPAGLGIGVNGGGAGVGIDVITATRDDSIYILRDSGDNNNFAARANSNGAAAVTNNLQNVPLGTEQLCTIEIPIIKKYIGHCIRLGKKGKGCVAGEHIIPYHLDCL